MRFTHGLEVKASPESVEVFLLNIKEVAQFIPGVDEVEKVGAGQCYQAKIQDRVGPFRVRVPIELKVVCAGNRRLKLEGNGRDAMTGSHIVMTLQSLVSPADAGSSALDLSVELQVTGRLASLGRSLISRKFNEKMNIFTARLREALEGGGEYDSSLSIS